MSALIDLIVRLFSVIFSTELERHDKQEKDNAASNNIEAFREELAKADEPAAIAAALADQHDRVQQALRDSRLDTASASPEVPARPVVHGQGAATASTPVLPRKPTDSLIERLKREELFSPCAYWDISHYTYGYGCEAPSASATISEPVAAKLLKERAQQSVDEFFVLFKGHEHKFNELRQECFIDMLFNMGLGNSQKGMRSFVNTLAHITDYAEPDWSRVSYNLEQSKWYKQVGKRAETICRQIKTGVRA